MLVPTTRATGSLVRFCTSLVTLHRAMPISSPGTMAMGNQAERESVAVKHQTSLSSNIREKLTGGVPLEDQQVTFPR